MLKKLTLGIIAALLLLPTLASAHESQMVIQVATKDGTSQKMALINAKNLKNGLGDDNVEVEIVVFGPGLGLLMEGSWANDRITALMSDHNVKFSVCEGTLKAYAKRHDGEMPAIIAGVSKVPTGALRILQLQQQGFAYMRP